jgi:DNA-binding SARP family transcriptional activator
MKKIAAYIAEQQYVRLKALAEFLGIKQAELLRRFLEEGLGREERRQPQSRRPDSAPPLRMDDMPMKNASP